MDESSEDHRLSRLEDAVFGPFRNNGLVGDVKGLRREVREWMAAEDKRRGEEDRDRRTGQRALIIALIAACIGLVAAVASLVGAGVLG